jgi:hypothetical protein
MRNLLLCGLLLLPLPALAQEMRLESIPEGAYQTGIEAVAGSQTRSFFLRNPRTSFSRGRLITTMAAEPFRGKSIRISTRLKLEDVATGAACAIDIPNGRRLIASRQGTILSGSRDWTECSVIVAVPQEAERLELRVSLAGMGTVWSDGFRIAPAE